MATRTEIRAKLEAALQNPLSGLVIGAALVGLFVILERKGHHLSAYFYWAVAVVLAIYFAWIHAHKPVDRDLVEVPKYACVYVEQVIGEYKSLVSSPDRPASQIIGDYEKLGKTTWGQLYLLERLLVRLEKPDARLARITSLRARHAALVGTAGPSLAAFDAAKLGTDADSVLAYVESALREVNRLLAVTACRERLRKRRLAYVGTIGLLALIVLITLTALSHNDFRGRLWLVSVPLAGALGGVISSQRRVQGIPSVGESLTDMTNLHFFGSSLAVSAISGAIFAAILYMLFAGELLKGGLFPDSSSLSDLAVPCAKNLARLLIWCFIAGFAERFVPDALDRLVSRNTKEH